MNEKNLIVCAKEIRYANGLGENISVRNELAVRVYTCTNLECAMRLQEDKKINILIIDEDFSYEERHRMNAEQIFVLTRTKEEVSEYGERQVFKFQSAESILSSVFQMYYNSTSESILKRIKKPCQRVIAVYSPIHRIGKTTFAIALGKELAKRGKTLYLNLEECPDVGGRLQRAVGRNLGDLLYYMRQDEQDISMRLETMICKLDELDYLPPILNSLDLREVPFSDWKKLLEHILNESVYETIVLDLGESVEGLPYLLQFCDGVYMPILEDPISKRKLAQFEQNLQEHHLVEMAEKTHRFVAVDDMAAYAAKWVKEGE